MVLNTMSATPDNHHGLEVSESANSDGAALHEAIRTLTSQLSLETVLQQVADLSRELVSATYSALGIMGGHGYWPNS